MADEESVVIDNANVSTENDVDVVREEKKEKTKRKRRRKLPKHGWALGLNDFNKHLLFACIAECFGTFLLILICVGSENSRVMESLETGGFVVRPLYYLYIATCFGLGIGAIIHIVCDTSGGHVNPAVSFALFVDKRISFVQMIFYMLSQFVGGFIGAGVLYGIGNHKEITHEFYGAAFYNTEDINHAQAFFFEAIGTMFLVLTVFATINDKKGHLASYLQPLSIGVAILVIHLWLLPYTNCGINPVRGSVWNIVIGRSSAQTFVFVFAPLLGAGVAVPIYNFLLDPS